MLTSKLHGLLRREPHQLHSAVALSTTKNKSTLTASGQCTLATTQRSLNRLSPSPRTLSHLACPCTTFGPLQTFLKESQLCLKDITSSTSDPILCLDNVNACTALAPVAEWGERNGDEGVVREECMGYCGVALPSDPSH